MDAPNFCCDQLKRVVYQYEHMFFYPKLYPPSTKDVVVEDKIALRLSHRKPELNGWVLLRFCPLCGSSLFLDMEEFE